MFKLRKKIAAVGVALIIGASTPISAFAAEQTSITQAYEKTVETPTASVDSGVYDGNRYVKLSCKTTGARIFYTLDGTVPTAESAEYGGYIRCKGEKGESVSYTIRAVAMKTGMNNSEIAEFNYTIQIPPDLDVIYMEIRTAPSKVNYNKGDKLNLKGGTLLVTYEDYTDEKISITENMISGFNTNTAGTKTLTVTYGGYTDSFKITVRDNGSGQSSYSPNGSSILSDEPTAEETLPTVSGSSGSGWLAVNEVLSKTKEGSSITVDTNGIMYVPSAIIRTAYKRGLYLSFEGLSDTMLWTLDTKKLTQKQLVGAGLGIRTEAVYIPEFYINNLYGTPKNIFHINSDNKLSAVLTLNLESENAKQYASLFRFNEEAKRMELCDTAIIDKYGNVELTPDKAGDYVIITDKQNHIKGDLDNNMKLTMGDFGSLMRIVTGGAKPKDHRADVNGDGSVNLQDALMLYKLIYNS